MSASHLINEESSNTYGKDDLNTCTSTTTISSKRKENQLQKVGPLPHLSTFHYEIEDSGIPIVPKPPGLAVVGGGSPRRGNHDQDIINKKKGTNTTTTRTAIIMSKNNIKMARLLGSKNVRRDDDDSTMSMIMIEEIEQRRRKEEEGERGLATAFFVKSRAPNCKNYWETASTRQTKTHKKENCNYNEDEHQQVDNLPVGQAEEVLGQGEEVSSNAADEEAPIPIVPDPVPTEESYSETLLLQERRLNLLLGKTFFPTSSSAVFENTDFLKKDQLHFLRKEEEERSKDEESSANKSHTKEHEQEVEQGVRPQEHWVEYWDEEVGANYYYNVVTGEASWVGPS